MNVNGAAAKIYVSRIPSKKLVEGWGRKWKYYLLGGGPLSIQNFPLQSLRQTVETIYQVLN